MRVFLSTVRLTFAMPGLAFADPSTTPGYTAKDQAQFARLAFGNGTWTCKDTPPSKKPDVITVKQDGNFYVWIDKSGSSEIYARKSPDPFAGTWSPAFPTGVGLYPATVSHSGNTFASAGKYKDFKTGKVVSFKSTCTKS